MNTSQRLTHRGPQVGLPVRIPPRADAAPGWSSRLTFVLAAAGSAVGLGNVWKFPYIAGEHGGGAFVLVYLACVAAIGLPVLAAEILIGRRGGGSPIQSFRNLAARQGHSGRWQTIGWMGFVCAFLILSFYSVVAGWAVAYLGHALSGVFRPETGVDTAERMSGLFAQLLAQPDLLLLCHSVVMALTVWIVARGIRAGLERMVRWMVPSVFGLLLLLVGYAAVTTGAFGEASAFLFRPDFAALTGESVLVALGHAFFTLSIGMTAMMAYSSHLSPRVGIGSSAAAIAGLDTLVALLAGLAIFPIVFSQGLEPAAGPGLIFVTLPIAFVEMPAGGALAIAFFSFVIIAALSSTISILEPVVEYLEERMRLGRRRAALLSGLTIWALGIASALSFNVLSGFTLWDKTVFDLLDGLTANVLLPLGGLLIAIYAGWVLDSTASAEELPASRPLLFRTWRFLLRYIAPVGIATVLLHAIL